MSVIIDKLEELKGLLIGKPISEQKKIIITFFYDNRKVNKHFKAYYKSSKDLFENSSLNDFILQEFINKTFITLEIMDFYTTINFYDWITKRNIKEIKLSIWTPETLDLDDPDFPIREQKNALIKNKRFKLRK